jgi:hypothetical protein
VRGGDGFGAFGFAGIGDLAAQHDSVGVSAELDVRIG